VWATRDNFQCQIIHLDYLLENIDRISDAFFIPTADDILRTRLRTTGKFQKILEVNNVRWVFTDVGGQLSERQKWKAATELHPNLIVFVVGATDFCVPSSEDLTDTKWGLDETVFKDVMSYEHFQDVQKILYINKLDLLEEKVHKDGWGFFHKAFPDFPKTPTNSPTNTQHDSSSEKSGTKNSKNDKNTIHSAANFLAQNLIGTLKSGIPVYSYFGSAMDEHAMPFFFELNPR